MQLLRGPENVLVGLNRQIGKTRLAQRRKARPHLLQRVAA